MSLDKKFIGRQIRLRRMEQNISQEKLSELIDISPRHMCTIENGKSFPSIDTLVKIAEILNLDLNDFFRLKEYKNNPLRDEAAALLLDFVQNAFEYQSDRQQFGHEKVFFPDEMLYYPYNDCEDRAILYCHLIRVLLGLNVALVNYPNHIAAAVCFPSQVKAETQYRRGNETYTLCDPTYLGASIGECMPQFIGKSPKLILLSK